MASTDHDPRPRARTFGVNRAGLSHPVNWPLLAGTLAVVLPLFAVWYLRGRLPPVEIDLGAHRISADGVTLAFSETAVVRLRVVNTECVRTDSDGDAASSRRIERTVWVEGGDRRIAVLETVNHDPGVHEFAADLARRIGVPLTEEHERD